MKSSCLLAVFLFTVTPLTAQNTCLESEKIGECWHRLSGEAAKEARETAESEGTQEAQRSAEQAEAELAEARSVAGSDVAAAATREAAGKNLQQTAGRVTGFDSPGTPFGSTIKDLLALFNVSADTGDLSQDGSTITFDINLPIFHEHNDIQLQAVLQEPVLYEPLKAALPEPTREARAAELADGFSDFDDYRFVLTYNHVSGKLGRNTEAFSKTFAAVIDSCNRKEFDLDLIGFTELLARHEVDETTAFASIADIEVRAELMDGVARVALNEAQLDDCIQKTATESGFFKFADLINNQPQLHASVTYRGRDDLVGPSTLSAKLTYEKGFANVNDFRQECDSDPNYLACLGRYLTRRAGSMKAGDRLTFSAEYERVDDYAIDLPSDGIMLDLDSEEKLSAVLAYGRNLFVDEEGEPQFRLDINATYEDVGDDPNRNDRTIVSVNLTKRITETVAAAVGISYANRPEFLGEVDREVSANVGLKYRIIRKEKQEEKP